MDNDFAGRSALSKDELAIKLGVSRDTITRRLRAGQIRFFKFGRRILIPTAELDRLLKSAALDKRAG